MGEMSKGAQKVQTHVDLMYSMLTIVNNTVYIFESC